jgi:hypothetical protein
MQSYQSTVGESGVVAYEIGRGSIVVKFVGGEKYLYTERSAGAGRTRTSDVHQPARPRSVCVEVEIDLTLHWPPLCESGCLDQLRDTDKRRSS